MHDKTLAMDCPEREPDPVLLEQLTALAAASTAPVVKPWWRRFTAKTGAAAVAGALIISAATADAEHGKPAPIVATVIPSTPPSHPSAHQKPDRGAALQISSVGFPSTVVPVRHAGRRINHRDHAHAATNHKTNHKTNQDGNRNRGGSGGVSSKEVRFARTVVSRLSAVPRHASPGPPQLHAHSPQRAHSRH